LRPHERGASGYRVEFIRANTARQEFQLASWCIEPPPAVGLDDVNGEWLIVFPYENANAIWILRVVM
jgi:hypothetical protein